MKILYLSTFNKEIYLASGEKMIQSFFATQKMGDLLCCYENLNPSKSFKFLKNSRFQHFDLSQSKFLNRWLEENKDLIPEALGGTATPEKKPAAFLPWNYRASGWFRKIATFEYALGFQKEYDALVFVDSDSRFLKSIPEEIFNQVFQDAHYFYHWGKDRKKKEMGVESGFIGFRTTPEGLYALNYWIDKYRNRVFKRYLQWDDGGMFGNVVLELESKHGKDLVTNYEDNGKSPSHVLERGIFAPYVIHDKGLHKRLGLINGKK